MNKRFERYKATLTCPNGHVGYIFMGFSSHENAQAYIAHLERPEYCESPDFKCEAPKNIDNPQWPWRVDFDEPNCCLLPCKVEMEKVEASFDSDAFALDAKNV